MPDADLPNTDLSNDDLPNDGDLTADADSLLRRLIGGSASAPDAVRTAAIRSTDVGLLVAAALLGPTAGSGGTHLLDRAAAFATTTRDRQLVAIAAALLAGDDERFDALVRDHLVEHPDHVLVAWIAAEHGRN